MNEPTAVSGVRRGLRELADGTIRVSLDIEPKDRAAFFRLFPEIDMPIAIAPLYIDHAPTQGDYGDAAKDLHQSSFFRTLDVLRAIGTDLDYRDWVRQKECCICNAEPPSEYSHVRISQAGKDSGGVAYKPEYRGVPMCHGCHSTQHHRGYGALAVKIGGRLNTDDVKNHLSRMATEYAQEWARSRLKAALGYDSWKHVPPRVLLAWAEERELTRHLPEVYRHA